MELSPKDEIAIADMLSLLLDYLRADPNSSKAIAAHVEAMRARIFE